MDWWWWIAGWVAMSFVFGGVWVALCEISRRRRGRRRVAARVNHPAGRLRNSDVDNLHEMMSFQDELGDRW
jgi:hypothetical protein